MKWVPIKGYEGLYEVSSAGEIKSLNRETLHPKGGKKILNEKILTGSFDKDGYVTVTLTINRTRKIHKVHRIVAESFIGNPLNKKTVNHIDGNKANNLVSNLEWNTHRENTIHRSLLKCKTSKYSNIHFCKTAGKWIAQIQNGTSKKMIGAFSSEEIAYNKLIEYKVYHGIK